MANLVKRGATWQYEISYKGPDGSFKKLRKAGFRTKGDARLEAVQVETELDKGYQPEMKNTLISDYFEKWYKLYKENSVSSTTLKSYEHTLSTIKKYLPFATLESLTKTEYQKALNKFASTHTKSTTKRFHTHMRAMMLDALDNKLVLNDITRKPVLKGKIDGKSADEKFLNYEDFKCVIQECKARLTPRHVSPYLIILGGATGARFSELLGLTWEDINFDKLLIDINKTWKLKEGFSPTKNKSSIRVVDIDEETATILLKYKNDQKEYFDDRGLKNKNNLVFCNPYNGPITANSVNNTLKRIQKELGIEHAITFHGLRHTHASVLLYKGINIVSVSERLGHKDVSVTQEVYSHVLDELKSKTKPKLAKAIEDMYV